jgi:hypothetical protein
MERRRERLEKPRKRGCMEELKHDVTAQSKDFLILPSGPKL